MQAIFPVEILPGKNMELMFVSQALKSQHCHKWNVLRLFNRKNCAWNEQRTKKNFNWAESNCTI